MSTTTSTPTTVETRTKPLIVTAAVVVAGLVAFLGTGAQTPTRGRGGRARRPARSLPVPVSWFRPRPTVTDMDTGTEASDFLRTRPDRITPKAAGLTASATGRRVKGLRRKEVATLAGVSAEDYNRMERGKLAGVSESVLYAR